MLLVDPSFHNLETRFFAVRLYVQLLSDLSDRPALGMKLTSAFNSAIVQVLFAGMRTGEPIRPVDSGLKTKKLVTVGAFFERPCSMKCSGELLKVVRRDRS